MLGLTRLAPAGLLALELPDLELRLASAKYSTDSLYYTTPVTHPLGRGLELCYPEEWQNNSHKNTVQIAVCYFVMSAILLLPLIV